MKNNPHKAPPRNGPARYPGIVRDAKTLGVTRTHLYAVLAGKRQSRRLVAAYRALNNAA